MISQGGKLKILKKFEGKFVIQVTRLGRIGRQVQFLILFIDFSLVHRWHRSGDQPPRFHSSPPESDPQSSPGKLCLLSFGGSALLAEVFIQSSLNSQAIRFYPDLNPSCDCPCVSLDLVLNPQTGSETAEFSFFRVS